MLTMAFLLSRVLDRVDSPQFHEWAGSRHVCERDAVASQGGEAKRAREKVDMMVHPHQRGGIKGESTGKLKLYNNNVQ